VIEVVNQRGIRFPGKGFALILLLSGLFAAYLLFKPRVPLAVTLVDNLTQGVLEGVGLLLTLPLWLSRGGQMRSPADSSQPSAAATSFTQRWVPPLLSLGILSYIIGQGIWTYNEDIAHLPVLFPSWADAGYLGSYPFVLLAILLLPRRPLAIQTRVRVFLDGLLIMVGVVTFSWYFVLGPTILHGAITVVGRIIGTAYPLADLLLIFCLLLLAARSHDREMQPMVLLFSLALVIIVITNSVYDYLEIHNLYATGGLLDVGWPLGYMLIGLGARAMQRYLRLSMTSVPAPVASVEKSESIGRPVLLRGALIPLLFVSAVFLLLIWTKYEGAKTGLEAEVSLGVTILLGLMVVRQVFVIQETISQNHLLRKTQQDLQARNEALRQAYEQLEEKARIEGAYEKQRRLNEMKDQFVLNVSHELRTPLTQVYGYLELLETYHNTLTSDKQVEYIRKATRGCEALLPLINTILDAAGTGPHMTPLQTQKLVVADLVHEVLEQFEPLQRQEHPVTVEIAEGLVVQADRQFLCQVLRNLLYNAFKYTPPQTLVRVAAARCDPTAGHPSGTSQVCICVQDAGPGIPPEDIPLLFGKFVRLKRDLAGPVRGTGLGLYISKQLVEAMGGSIWVESSGVSGQGSRFYFTLPELNRRDEPLPQKQEDDAAKEADGFLVRGAFALPRSQRTSRAI
jgi:signal transduction histidine kinase